MFLSRKKELYTSEGPEETARVRAALEKENIKYKIKTLSKSPAKAAVRMSTPGRLGNFTSGYSTASSMTTGTPQSWMEGGSKKNYSTFFVKAEDYDRAKEICGI